MKKLTLEEIDKKVQKIHKNQVSINWEKTGEYKNTKQKVWAQDISAGEWEVSIDKLLQGRGHPLKKEQRLKLTKDQVELAIKKIHGDTISLDWVRTGVFQNKAKQKVWAIDKDFGPWEIKLGDLLKGVTHRKRYYLKKTLTKEDVNQRVAKLFQGVIKIDWTGVDNFNTKSKVVAIDKDFGSWKVVLSKLLLGANHPLRARDKMAQGKMLSVKEINERIEKVHFGKVKIDWDKTGEYVNSNSKVLAQDRDYGLWKVKVQNLLQGQEHPLRSLNNRKLTKEEIDEKILNIFQGDIQINWSLTGEYVNNQQKIFATHKKYGDWNVRLGHLLQGSNHPDVIKFLSKGEEQVLNWIKNLESNILVRKQFLIDDLRKEIDIFIVNKSVGIEYNGLYWHSDLFVSPDYHLNKSLFFKNLNIKILHFFENEWKNDSQKVKNIILKFLDQIQKVNLFNFKIKKIDDNQGNSFLKENDLNINEFSHFYGLYENSSLISIVSCKIQKEELFICKYSELQNKKVLKGREVLLKFLEKKFNPKTVIVESDLRYEDEKLWLNLGFKESLIRIGEYKTDFKDLFLKEDPMAKDIKYKIYDAGVLKLLKTIRK